MDYCKAVFRGGMSIEKPQHHGKPCTPVSDLLEQTYHLMEKIGTFDVAISADICLKAVM